MADKARIYEDVLDMVEDEIDKIYKKGELDEKCLEHLDKLVDISKDIKTITAMDEYGEDPQNGYSQMRRPYYNSYDDGMMANRSMNGNSYQRRDSMGRYMRSYDSGNYSRDNGMASRLEGMTEHEREALRRALEQM